MHERGKRILNLLFALCEMYVELFKLLKITF